jgi:hypothetical protein
LLALPAIIPPKTTKISNMKMKSAAKDAKKNLKNCFIIKYHICRQKYLKDFSI